MPPRGAGLVRDSGDWNIIKSQLESGLFDLSKSIPHQQILDYNIEEKNWAVDKYDYTPFASSIQHLVNQLHLKRGNTGKLLIELLLFLSPAFNTF